MAGRQRDGAKGVRRSSSDEVLRLGVVADDGGCGLLGLVLVARLLRAVEPDAAAVEQLEHTDVVLEIGTGGIAPRVAAAAVLLAEEPGERGAVLIGEAPLLTDTAMPVLRQRLRHLHTEAVQVEILLVPIICKQLRRRLG